MSTDTELGRLLHSVVPEPPRLPYLASTVTRRARRRRAARLGGGVLAMAAAAALTLLVWPQPGMREPVGAGPLTTGATNPPAMTCPAVPPTQMPRSPRTNPRGPLVPDNPAHLTICWYATQPVRDSTGSPVKPATPTGHWVLDPQAAAPFIAALNGFPPPLGGTHSCPMDDGSTALLLFQYSDGHPVWVNAKLTGCRTIDNGMRLAWDTDGQIPDRINHLR